MNATPFHIQPIHVHVCMLPYLCINQQLSCAFMSVTISLCIGMHVLAHVSVCDCGHTHVYPHMHMRVRVYVGACIRMGDCVCMCA